MVGGWGDMSLRCVTDSLPKFSAPKTIPYPPLVFGVPVNTGGNSNLVQAGLPWGQPNRYRLVPSGPGPDCMEVFMDDFTVYADSFDACLENLSKVLTRCINTNLVLNFENCHFMVTKGIVLGYLVSNRGIEVDKSKIDIITFLPNHISMREVRSFLGHARFNRRFIKNFSKIALPLPKLLQKDVDFKFDQPCVEAFQELKNRLTSAPILQAPN
ncbi:Retrovirus-related Pol polyprotein from transposon opus, partial [Mucuna pruriens]